MYQSNAIIKSCKNKNILGGGDEERREKIDPTILNQMRYNRILESVKSFLNEEDNTMIEQLKELNFDFDSLDIIKKYTENQNQNLKLNLSKETC